MVNAANEVCCVRINIFFSRPDISQDESSMAASFVLFFFQLYINRLMVRY